MPLFSTARILAPLTAAAVLLVPASGAMEPKDIGTIFFKTNVGSFKILGLPVRSAEGKIQVSFTGTMLINRASMTDPKISFTGNLKKEYDNTQHLQVAYHGTGKMVIDGHFQSIQWFGRNMSAQWDGFGIARLVGEFDKELKTGEYWYALNPTQVRDWGTQLKEVPNPGTPGKDYDPLPTGRNGG